MALIASTILTQLSGKLGGLVFARNAGGAYMRQWVKPINPGSVLQELLRGYFGNLVYIWAEELDDAERESWAEYAANTLRSNRLGDLRSISGQNEFVSANVPRLQAGMAVVTTAPSIFDRGDGQLIDIQPDESDDTIDVSWTPSSTWADEAGSALLVYIGLPQNPGVNYFKGPYRLAGTILGNATTPPASPYEINNPWTMQAGQRAFWQTRVTRVDGRLSEVFRGFNSVVA